MQSGSKNCKLLDNMVNVAKITAAEMAQLIGRTTAKSCHTSVWYVYSLMGLEATDLCGD